MKEMINNIGERLIHKMRVINICTREFANDERRFSEPRKLNKFDHEFRGMLDILKTMGIEFEIEYNDDVTEMTAITIMGQRFEANK